MSLYGAMFSGVSGMNSQGSKIAMTADNITNINTVGYKANSTHFSTFVTSASSNTSYSSGGVTASNHRLVETQGLLQATSIATDLAISGRGMFVVNTKDDGTGEYAYTRAGSFTFDKKGNFVNKAGYLLYGWQLDSEGRLPGEIGNLDTTSSALLESLGVVSKRTISGAASASTSISLGMNLRASETIYEGSGETISFPSLSPNSGISSTGVIIPDSTAGMELVQGDILSLTPSNPGTTYNFTYGGVEQTNDVSTTILGASTVTQRFTAATEGDNFTITTPTVGERTFSYSPSSATASSGKFRDLNTLAEAINKVDGLSARINGNRMYVTPTDGTESMTFNDVTGTFVASLGLNDIAASPNRFSTLEGLKSLINDNANEGVTASIGTPSQSATLKFYSTDPLGTIITTTTALSGVAADHLALKSQFGIDETAQSVIFGPAYDATDDNKNIASGNIAAQFTRNIRVFDSLGTGHDFRIGFVKIDHNNWAVEVYSANPEEVTNAGDYGQVAYGIIQFNGDGTLASISEELINPVEIAWLNEAELSEVRFDWGTYGEVAGTEGAATIGLADGMSQLDADYNVNFINNNGIEPGLLTNVTIDDEGFVIANFSNGYARKVFKLPLAQFANVNGLAAETGNIFSETNLSGNFNLTEAKNGGSGAIRSGQLENANVELSDELTKVIIAQRGYQANSKIIKTVNDMLEELNRIL